MGTKPTVVSIKRHEALKEAFNEAKEQLAKYAAEVAALREKASVLDQPSLIRPELSWFIGECEKSLKYHDPVRGDSYKKLLPESLVHRMMAELQQVLGALTGHATHDKNNSLIRAAVNISNFCMMMAHNAAVNVGIYPLSDLGTETWIASAGPCSCQNGEKTTQ